MEIQQKKYLFWDTKTLDLELNKQFIIDRIFQFGQPEDYQWARSYYGDAAIKGALRKSKTIDAKSFVFWCQHFSINPQECLFRQSTPKQNAFSRR